MFTAVLFAGLLAASAPVAEGDTVRLCGRDWPVDATELTCQGSPYSSTLEDGRLPEALAQFPHLTSLTLKRLTLKDCTVLGRLTGLKALDLAHTKVVDPACLGAATTIEQLSLRDAKVSGIEPLVLLTQLRELRMPVRLTDLSPLASVPSLEVLDLKGTTATDLKPLGALVNLKRLDLSQAAGVVDASPLKGLEALRHLDLTATGVKKLTWIKGLAALQHLVLADTAVEDIRPLASLEGLVSLDLAATPVKRLPRTKRWVALERLVLSDTFVTKVKRLRKLLTLKHLDLMGTEVSEEEIAKLTEALPECTIER